MTSRTGQIAAVDLGATSGRVMLASVGPSSLDIRPLTRFANEPVYLWNGERSAMHWDVPGLFRHACKGLAEALRQAPDLVSIGVDSWAVDYGLLRRGTLAGLPHHYRDTRCDDGVAIVHKQISQQELHARNGLQFLPFNTVYQLAAEKRDGALEAADRALLVPDLIGYWLTGTAVTERTNGSTTGLLGVDGHWDDGVDGTAGPAYRSVSRRRRPGDRPGPRASGPCGRWVWRVVRTSVPSLRTTPPRRWSPCRWRRSRRSTSPAAPGGLVGVELSRPVMTEAARSANFTNEVGADGRIRFLRNVMGLWLLSESIRHWERGGCPHRSRRSTRTGGRVPAPQRGVRHRTRPPS